MAVNCELNCICEDCLKKHRVNGCNFGAGLYYVEDNDDNCDCEEL